MTRDELYDLVLGAASVAIIYMLLKQHKKAAQPSMADTVSNDLANIVAPVDPFAIDWNNLFAGVI
jgi:hypothetical protein